jgi:hypothetical protein
MTDIHMIPVRSPAISDYRLFCELGARFSPGHNVDRYIVQFQRGFTIVLILAGAACAQTLEDGLKSKIAGVRYLPLAEAARIQGDVHLSLNSGVATVLSGHPMLAHQAAIESAKAFGSIQGETKLDVTYHFALVDTDNSAATSTTVPRGNAFERAVLRMFGRKTEKVVLDHSCQERVPPANDLKVSGAVIEVWIYGRARCIQNNAERQAIVSVSQQALPARVA